MSAELRDLADDGQPRHTIGADGHCRFCHTTGADGRCRPCHTTIPTTTTIKGATA